MGRGSKRKSQKGMVGKGQIMDWNKSFQSVEYDARTKAKEGSCVMHPITKPVIGEMMMMMIDILF